MCGKWMLAGAAAMIVCIVAAGTTVAAPADDATQNAAVPAAHEGTVVSVTANKLTMKDEAGKEHSHTVGTDAKITVNGKPGKLEDLKMGVKIQVMTGEAGKVLSISTIDKAK
jgi:hypothetical protein